MAFPLDFFENFEAGTKGNFDSETDTGNRLDFPHAHDIAPTMPYRGAYCCRVNLGKNSSDAYLEEGVSWASGTTKHGRFRLFVGHDVQFGNDLDNVRILQFYSEHLAKETSLRLGRMEPWHRAGASTRARSGQQVHLPDGQARQWITVEWISASSQRNTWRHAAGPGRSTRRISPSRRQGTNTKLRLGAIDQSGDITGTIYFDDFAVDDARLYDDNSAHNGALSGGSMLLTKSGFAFLGAGTINQVALVDGGSGDCSVKVYDTDKPNQLPLGSLRESLATVARTPLRAPSSTASASSPAPTWSSQARTPRRSSSSAPWTATTLRDKVAAHRDGRAKPCFHSRG